MVDKGRPHRQRRRGRRGRSHRRRRWFACCPPFHSSLTTTALSHTSPLSPNLSSSKPPVSSHGSSSERRMSWTTARRGRGVCGGRGGGTVAAFDDQFYNISRPRAGVVGPGGVLVGRSPEKASRRVRKRGCVARAHWRRPSRIPFKFGFWRRLRSQPQPKQENVWDGGKGVVRINLLGLAGLNSLIEGS